MSQDASILYNSLQVMFVRLINRMLDMCELSWEILMKSLMLSCILLFCAWMLLVDAGSLTAANYGTYLLAEEMTRLPQAILLFGVLASGIVEDVKTR